MLRTKNGELKTLYKE